MTFHSGFLALVGRPNVGKSTLINALVGEKVAIVSPKAQTTRCRIHGIVNRPTAQLIFADTPGLTRRSGTLNRTLRRIAGEAAADCDLTVLVVTATDGRPEFAEEDIELFDAAKAAERPVVVVLNKLDKLQSKASLLPWMEAAHTRFAATAIVPISARTGDGVPELLDTLEKLLPEGAALFPTDLHTDQAERFLCAELIREQLLRHLEQEVPHSCAVVIDTFEDSLDDPDAEPIEPGGPLPPRKVRILGRIVVERESQKGIVVGKGGVLIKEVSRLARLDMEQVLDAKVFVRLEVVVDRDWTEREGRLENYGVGVRGSAS